MHVSRIRVPETCKHHIIPTLSIIKELSCKLLTAGLMSSSSKNIFHCHGHAHFSCSNKVLVNGLWCNQCLFSIYDRSPGPDIDPNTSFPPTFIADDASQDCGYHKRSSNDNKIDKDVRAAAKLYEAPEGL